jgi:uncharacterized protein
MDYNILDEFTRQYIEIQEVPEVTFSWQGGEPALMGLNFLKKALKMQKKYVKADMKVINTFQTNGTNMDDEWVKFLHDSGFLTGISIDGPPELHDFYRKDKNGKGSHERVMKGLKYLKKHQVEFNILTCVHAANAEYPWEVYRFLRDDIGAKFIQFIPVVEKEIDNYDNKVVSDHSVTGKQYGEFLIKIFNEWVRRDVGEVFVQIFDVALGVWLGFPPGMCVFSPTCGTALALEHNGDVYSCDHFVEPDYKLGNILKSTLNELVSSQHQVEFGLTKKKDLPEKCLECTVRFACNGGCPKNRLQLEDNEKQGLNYLCDGYKAFFTHIDPYMRLMAKQLRAGKPATNIMRYLETKDADFLQERKNK